MLTYNGLTRLSETVHAELSLTATIADEEQQNSK
jgi:hypothetical protein